MGGSELNRRSFMGASVGTAAGLGSIQAGSSAPAVLDDDEPGLYTQIAFRALVDAVIPETPALGEELGEEYVAGGLKIDLAEFMITYVNNMFSFDLPLLSDDGNLQIARPFAKLLDTAALKLIALGDNEAGLDFDRVRDLFDDDEASTIKLYLLSGPFSKLKRTDRLRAIALLDELELELSFGTTLFELDGGMVGQLVIGFTEAVYYSEWQGYNDFFAPPSERDHPNDPAAVQGWRQTEFPGLSDGETALRGYLGAPGSDLGAGEVWKSVDDGVDIYLESGAFPENDYDTSDYEEPFPVESAEGDGEDAADDGIDDEDTAEGGSDDEGDNGTADEDDDSNGGWWF